MVGVLEKLERKEDCYLATLEYFDAINSKECVGAEDELGTFKRELDLFLTNRFNRVFDGVAVSESFCNDYADVYDMVKTSKKASGLFVKFKTLVNVETALIERQEKTMIRNGRVMGVKKLYLASKSDSRIYRDNPKKFGTDRDNDIVIKTTIYIPNSVRSLIKTEKINFTI